MMRTIAHSFALLLAGIAPAFADTFGPFEDMASPVGRDAREPSLHVTSDGRLLMSWTETGAAGAAMVMATFRNGAWSAPQTITQSPDLFLNWADFPSVSSFNDGTLIAHWLRVSGQTSYDYDVQIALSDSDGAGWTMPFAPHGDGTSAQHGFVSLAPLRDKVVAVWLDGRAYDGALLEKGAAPDRMQLRAAILSSDGSATPDAALDLSTCSCCQTDAAVAGDALLVVYRDRTEAEIRDIALVRLSDGAWSTPMRVHEDNWEISGCPVNGPSISAQGDEVIVAWFTAAGDVPAVKVALSDNAGASFGPALRIDGGAPGGRVDTLMLPDGTALVSWVEWDGPDERLLLCRITAEGCTGTREVATNTTGSSINFPRMAATPEAIFIAWTQPLPGGGDTIRMVRASR